MIASSLSLAETRTLSVALNLRPPEQAVGADLILQVGDFGFWPRSNSNSGQKYLRKVDARLATAGLTLLVDADGYPIIEEG